MSHGLVRLTAVPKTRRTIFLVLIVAGAASAAVVAIAVWKRPARTMTAERPLELVVSADTAGFIIPCGCTSNQCGGFPRRGTEVKAGQETPDRLGLGGQGAAGG